MAVSYKSAGTGAATETSGADLAPTCPATVDANDILIAHVFWEGTTTAPSTPSGWTLLSGPHVIESTIARHWVFGKLAAGTEDGASVSFGTPAVTTQRGARIYSFSGYSSGTITQICHFFSHQSHATDPQGATVTTSIAGALAINLIGQNDNNAQGSFTGESGGDWTEAVAEFTANLTPGLALQLQTATPTSDPGTISGGTFNTTNDPVGVIGFAIEPSPWSTLTANAAGDATTTATIVKVQGGQQYSLTASPAGSSTVVVSERSRRMLGTFTVAGTSSASTPTLYRRVVVASSGALAGTSTASATIAVVAVRSATATGTSAVAVSMGVVRALGGVSATGTSTATSAFAAPAGTTYQLTANAAGTATAATPTLYRRVVVASSGSLGGTGSVVVSVTKIAGGSLTVSAAGTGAASATLYKITEVSGGSVTGTSTATVSIQITKSVQTTVAGIATASVAMAVVRALSTSATGVSATSALFSGAPNTLTATPAGTATVSVSVLLQAHRSASASGISATVVAISVKRALVASPVGTGSAAANDQAVRTMLAAAAAVAVADVTANYQRILSPTASGTALVTLALDVTLGTTPVVGKYAAEHAAAYRVVQAAESGDFSGIHGQAFADVFKAGV